MYHSKLSAGERYDTWRQTIQGEPQVVIGTRSAIFTPLPNIGLIILDEEHDSSFKQDRPAPTYHARKVAQWRAELENCPLVLGSATPSLESLVAVDNVASRREPPLQDVLVEQESSQPSTFYLSLPERIGDRPLPKVAVVDLRERVKSRQPALFLVCPYKMRSPRCSNRDSRVSYLFPDGDTVPLFLVAVAVTLWNAQIAMSLSYHHTHEGAAKLLRCHYCNHTRIQPDICPECNSPYLKFFGSGTQKVTQELAKLFPRTQMYSL